MRKIAIIIPAMMLIMAYSCNKGKGSKVNLEDNIDSVSYIIGVNVANDLKNNFEKQEIEFDANALSKGFSDAFAGDDSLITKEEQERIMSEFQMGLQQKQMARMSQEAIPQKEAGSQWLAQNRMKEGVVELPSGLQYKILNQGKGEKPSLTDQVKVHYEGRLIDGSIFESSYERGEPIEIQLNQVIRGWQEGVQLISPGGKIELFIPSDLGYGDRGSQDIPGGSVLIFTIDLISFTKGDTQQ
jgi:FKBP-type peptidyl-prolyl cis-trans isomerase FklB